MVDMDAKSLSKKPSKSGENGKNKKMKDVIILEDPKPWSNNSSFENAMLDLNLSSLNPVRLSKHNNNSSRNESLEEKPASPRVFSCNYCKGEFSTSQALGGHQNAHKQERARDKMRRASTRSAPYNLYHPYSNIYSIPNYDRSLLGVKTKSMIHKHGYAWPLIHGYGHPRPSSSSSSSSSSLVINPQPSYYDRWRMSNKKTSISPFTNLNNLSRSLPKLDLNGNSKGTSVSDQSGNSESGDVRTGSNLEEVKPESSSCLDLSLRL